MVINPEHINSNEPATKGDLEQLREDLQGDMANMEQRIMDKFDAWGETLFEKMDALIENRHMELGAAKTERVELLENKVEDLSQRVATIESR